MFLPTSLVGSYTTSFSSCQPKLFKESLHWLWHPSCSSDQSFTAQNWCNLADPEQCLNCRIRALKTENLGSAHSACQHIRLSNLLSIWQSKQWIRDIPEETKSCVCSERRLDKQISSTALLIFKQKGIILPVKHTQRHKSPRPSVAAHQKTHNFSFVEVCTQASFPIGTDTVSVTISLQE